jgi:chromosome condensin MukBEF complex kleisin-like MukF subunit
MRSETLDYREKKKRLKTQAVITKNMIAYPKECAFDIIQFVIHQQHRKKGSQNLSSGLSLSKQGIGLCYNF